MLYSLNKSGKLLKQRSYSSLDGLHQQVALILLKSVYPLYLLSINSAERKPFSILGLVATRVIVSGRTEVKSINELFLFKTSANLPSLMRSSNFLATTIFIGWGSAALILLGMRLG